MSLMQTYVAIAIGALALVLLVGALMHRRIAAQKLSPLAAIAFSLVVAGIVFGENRWVGYSLIGTGVALSILDILRRKRHT